jgi:hypothetical protein
MAFFEFGSHCMHFWFFTFSTTPAKRAVTRARCFLSLVGKLSRRAAVMSGVKNLPISILDSVVGICRLGRKVFFLVHYVRSCPIRLLTLNYPVLPQDKPLRSLFLLEELVGGLSSG